MSSDPVAAALWSVVIGIVLFRHRGHRTIVVIGLICFTMLWLPAWPFLWMSPMCLLPLSWIQRRQQAVIKAQTLTLYWPWLVDLMRIAISGGAAHGAAFDHAVLALKETPIGSFGTAVFRRRDAGQSRVSAILSVADELKSREGRDLGLAMQESERQGSDLSPLLAEQARSLREKTQRRLERAANGLSVKLLIPLVICFFPTFFMVLAFTILQSLGRLPG